MKYKKSKLKLNEIDSAIQDSYFLVKFGLVLIYILKFIVKNHFQFYWENICSIHYLHFAFEKHVPSQVFKDFSVENLETTPSNFISKFFSEIFLSPIINYWGSIFTLHLTWGAFSLVCVVNVMEVLFWVSLQNLDLYFSIFFLSFLLRFFLSLLIFSLTDTKDS